MNLKYFIDMVDTSIFNKNLNKLTVEDLINSSLIFEIIDSYALQYEELKKFEIEVETFRNKSEEILSINRMESLLELYKRRVDGYFYADVRYKILLDYEIIIDSSKLKKIKTIDKFSSENIDFDKTDKDLDDTNNNISWNEIGDFVDLCEQHKNLAGLNVTIPYKEKIIPFLDELNNEAAAKAKEAGLKVVQNKCTKIEHRNLF